MSHGIHKDDVNRWFLISNDTPGEPGFVLFGVDAIPEPEE